MSARAAHAAAERLDQAFGGDWSFRVLASEIREAEVIVLGELSAAGAARQQFGYAPTSGAAAPLAGVGERLREAAHEALVACAGAFGARAGGPSRSEGHDPAPNNTVNGGRSFVPLSDQQLSAIFGLARFRGLSEDGVCGLARERFGKEPPELDALQAAQVISDLVVRPQKGVPGPSNR